jgi:hypothetical protein
MTKLSGTISAILLLLIIQIKANRLLQHVHACTEEAKECPDGSFVSRTSPNCEFAQCPHPSPPSLYPHPPPCEVLQCLISPCPCTTCPGDNACLKDGKCNIVAKCFADPCISNPCPGEICTADYCGGCAYKCETDCSLVFCAQPFCTTDETLVTLAGECCPFCQLDCSKVLCLKPICAPGYELVVPELQCCPVCKPTCPDTETMEFVQCAGCHTTCGNINPVCDLMCQAGCRCKEETPIWSAANGKCISAAECVDDCSVVRCAEPVCGENEVEVTPAGQCCAICESNGDTFNKVECNIISDCDVDYKCRRDPKCGHLTGYEKLLCASESATKKVCWRQQIQAFCPMDDCVEGYECVMIRNGNGICVDYQ